MRSDYQISKMKKAELRSLLVTIRQTHINRPKPTNVVPTSSSAAFEIGLLMKTLEQCLQKLLEDRLESLGAVVLARLEGLEELSTQQKERILEQESRIAALEDMLGNQELQAKQKAGKQTGANRPSAILTGEQLAADGATRRRDNLLTRQLTTEKPRPWDYSPTRQSADEKNQQRDGSPTVDMRAPERQLGSNDSWNEK